MVKLSGPCMSLGASGTLADAITFSSWKGRPYARERVIPSNPKSGMQTGLRAMMSGLSKHWADMSAVEQAYWDDRAKAAVISNFNALIGFNMSRWKQATGPVVNPLDLTANGTLPEAGAGSATGGPSCMTIAQIVVAVNDGWLFVLHSATNQNFTATISNAVKAWGIKAAGTLTWVHSPIAAGVHYYKCSRVTKDGQLAIGVTEFSGTAT